MMSRILRMGYGFLHGALSHRGGLRRLPCARRVWVTCGVAVLDGKEKTNRGIGESVPQVSLRDAAARSFMSLSTSARVAAHRARLGLVAMRSHSSLPRQI